jgi:hypothetical protein
MSTRTSLGPTIVIPSAQGSPANSSSMAANITSAPTILRSMTLYSYSVVWTGVAPVGVVSVEVSNDCVILAQGGVGGGTWNPMPLGLLGSTVFSIPISGNSGNGMIDIVNTGINAVRLVYTATSGTGTLSATINGKVA